MKTISTLPRLFHGPDELPGPFVHAINAIYGGMPKAKGREKVSSQHINRISDEDIRKLDSFALIIAIKGLKPPTIALRETVVRAINERRCRLVFDFSNEAGNGDLVRKLTVYLKEHGVHYLHDVFLLCQNRDLCALKSAAISIIPFDRTVLFGVNTANQLRTSGSFAKMADRLLDQQGAVEVLCMNATPRIHRIHTILEMIYQGLVQKTKYDTDADIRLRYVSLSRLDYSKGATLTEDAIKDYLRHNDLEHLEEHLSWLLSVLPLRVDKFNQEGNQLSTKLSLDPYIETKLSIVTETGVGRHTRRITEKTAKAMALGHPFVIVGHKGSVACVRELGFCAFDRVIDQSYDDIDEIALRISTCIRAASSFTSSFRSNSLDMSELSTSILHNMHWAASGFFDFYWDKYIRPIIRMLSRYD